METNRHDPRSSWGRGRLPLDYAFYQDCLTRIAYEPARNLTVPTLIVQGDHDEFVPLHQSQRLFDAFPALNA